jgi:hypothetical protein
VLNTDTLMRKVNFIPNSSLDARKYASSANRASILIRPILA